MNKKEQFAQFMIDWVVLLIIFILGFGVGTRAFTWEEEKLFVFVLVAINSLLIILMLRRNKHWRKHYRKVIRSKKD